MPTATHNATASLSISIPISLSLAEQYHCTTVPISLSLYHCHCLTLAHCFAGLLTASDDEEYNISCSEALARPAKILTSADVYSDSVRASLSAYNSIVLPFEEGALASSTEAQEIVNNDQASCHRKCDYTFGECGFDALTTLLAAASIQPGEEFCDLGCATGKAVIIAALQYPTLRRCWGVELLQTPLQLGMTQIAQYDEYIESRAEQQARVAAELVQGDFFQVDWSGADVVYIASTMFGKVMMAKIAEVADALKVGSRVITTDQRLPCESFKVVMHFQLEMAWGECEAFLQIKT